jgi:hypothetical protein
VFKQPSERKHTFLVEAYRQSLHDAAFTFVLGFEMVDEKGSPLWLFFGTNDRTGLEKMKDAMWLVDPNYGIRYRDPHDPDQMVLDVDHPGDMPLAMMLTAQLQLRPQTLDELREYALTETVYRPQHVRGIMREQLRRQRVTRNDTGQLRGDSLLAITPRR